ncbi:hypothetical protein LTR10_009662 [Elasticomyces elasticus]|nr:hypothetical protein LTR10_009662 [Elasticomyces elasticus]KAK4969953.1 hypothetical protein LTR42_008119 [Elasticomyces elasticus]
MPRNDHTCGLADAHQRYSCRACRELVLMGVGSSPSQNLPQLAQGHRLLNGALGGQTQQRKSGRIPGRALTDERTVQPTTDAWLANARVYPQSSNRPVTDDPKRAEHVAPTHSMIHHPYPLSIDFEPASSSQSPQQANNQTFDRNVPILYRQCGNEILVGSLSQAWDQRTDSSSEYARQVRRANITYPRGVRASPASDDASTKRRNVRRDSSR